MHKKKGFVVRIGDWFYGEKLSYSKYMKSEMMLEELTEKELTDITSEFKNLLHQIDFFPAPTEEEMMMHLSKKINLFTVDKFIYRKEGEMFSDYCERFRLFFEANKFLFTIENRHHIVGLLREHLRFKGVNTTYREFCRYVRGEITFDEIRDWTQIAGDSQDEKERESIWTHERYSMFDIPNELLLP